MNTATEQLQQIKVTATARLHMGFYDLSHQSKQAFGGMGLAIDSPSTQVIVAPHEKLFIDDNGSENVVKIVENLISLFNIPKNFSLKIAHKIPEHTGLGSGTQMALAIGAALSALFGLNLSNAQIATASMRGKRSGIGLGAFSQGGFLVDSGKQVNALPAIQTRMHFCDDWRVLLVQDSAHIGVNGAAELAAFGSLKPFASSLTHMVQQHMLPALQRGDLLAFGAYMEDLQAYNGDYFAPIQGGRFASGDVAKILTWLQANGAACVGQSSWGPTGFAILPNMQLAEQLKKLAQAQFASQQNISFAIVNGKNTGASIAQKNPLLESK